ncbi:MAG: hypothetical protein GX299_09710 [Epulopiscium sp.]|jgi:hypothetical protein|nr:hypothetical protein [Candidatus Epulonipiscium sp.]
MEYYLGASKIIICDDACSNPNQQEIEKQILKQVATKALPALRQNTENAGRENKEKPK